LPPAERPLLALLLRMLRVALPAAGTALLMRRFAVRRSVRILLRTCALLVAAERPLPLLIAIHWYFPFCCVMHRADASLI
jgi:hypothetical protein